MKPGQIILNLLLRKPYYGYIASNMKLEKSNSIEDIKVIIGPVVKLVYNEKWMNELKEQEAYGVFIHEILHLVLLHYMRKGSRESSYWSIACDLAVNEHIDEKILPEGYFTVEMFNRETGFSLPSKSTAEYYYDEILKRKDNISFIMRDGAVKIKLPGGDEFAVKSMEQPDTSDLNYNAAKSLLEEVTCLAAKEGEIPGTLKNIISEIYGGTDVDWRNLIKKYLSGKGRMNIRKTVKRNSKRFNDNPGNKRVKQLNALVAIDESGSISDDDIMMFYSDLKKIKAITKSNLLVTRFDTDCTRPVRLEQYLKIKNRIKSGGTDFRPVFQVAESMQTRLMIIFTDGDGILPDVVKQKTLWIITGSENKIMPFGDTVRFSN